MKTENNANRLRTLWSAEVQRNRGRFLFDSSARRRSPSSSSSSSSPSCKGRGNLAFNYRRVENVIWGRVFNCVSGSFQQKGDFNFVKKKWGKNEEEEWKKLKVPSFFLKLNFAIFFSTSLFSSSMFSFSFFLTLIKVRFKSAAVKF